MKVPNDSTASPGGKGVPSASMTRRRFLWAAALLGAAALLPLGAAARILFENAVDLPARIRARTRPLDMASVRRPAPWAG